MELVQSRPKVRNQPQSATPLHNIRETAMEERAKRADSLNVNRGSLPLNETTARPAELLPLSRAAVMAGVCEKSLKREIDLGRLPAIRLGDRWRINSEILRRWLQGEFHGVTAL